MEATLVGMINKITPTLTRGLRFMLKLTITHGDKTYYANLFGRKAMETKLLFSEGDSVVIRLRFSDKYTDIVDISKNAEPYSLINNNEVLQFA